MPKQILSWHPDMDRYLPWVTLYGIFGITAVMSVYEVSSSIVWPYIKSYFPPVPISTDVVISPAKAYEVIEYVTKARDHVHEQHPALTTNYKVYDEPVPYTEWPRDLDGTLIFLPTYDWQPLPMVEKSMNSSKKLPINIIYETPPPPRRPRKIRLPLPVLFPPGIEFKLENGRRYARAPPPTTTAVTTTEEHDQNNSNDVVA